MGNHKFQPPRGTRDVFENRMMMIENVESVFFETARSFGYQRIDIPMFEHLEVFQATSLVDVGKCYVFKDKSDRELILRPDINAPISRSIVNNIHELAMPAKIFFSGKVFRYRHRSTREFIMSGVENYGINDLNGELEVLLLMSDVLSKLGLGNRFTIEFNNLALYSRYLDTLSLKDSTDSNSSELLRKLALSKDPIQRRKLLEFLPPERVRFLVSLLEFEGPNSEAFKIVMDEARNSTVLQEQLEKLLDFEKLLKLFGFNDYRFDVSNLHGTGFYSGLTYRIGSEVLTKKIADGGRYDTFTETLGGPSIAATGIGFGLERLTDLAYCHGSLIPSVNNGLLLVPQDDIAIQQMHSLASTIRSKGLPVEVLGEKAKFKNVVKYANFKNYRKIVFVQNGNGAEGLLCKVYDLVNRVSKTSNFVELPGELM